MTRTVATSPELTVVWALPAPEREPVDALLCRLSPQERRHAAIYHDEPARRRFVSTRVALRDLLARCTDCEPDALRIHRDRAGKPFAVHPDGIRMPQFNVTHADGLALVAIDPDRAVGIDVEPAMASVADLVEARVCTAEELAELAPLDWGERAARFVRLWVRKEAVSKADGRGMRLGFNRIDARSPGPITVEDRDGLPAIHVRDLDVGRGYCAAVASTGPPIVRHVRIWDITGRAER